jgi:hypothetical protein
MDNQRESRVRTFLKLFLICGALVIFGCVLTPYFTARPGHDQSSYLFEAQRLLAGAELYGPHLSETNPPMIVWFSILPVLLGRWMHGSPTFFFRLIVMALVFCSTAWCISMLRRGTVMTNLASLGLLAFALLASEFYIGPYNFGQREHLLIILLLPYILATVTGAVSRLSFAERSGLGVAAGIAIWFKPQDVLILAGLELFLSFRARNLRRVRTPEFLALILTSLAVLLLVRLTTPLYGTVTLQLLFDTYWALGTVNAVTLALSLHYYMLQVFLVLLACLIFRRYLRDPRTPVALLVCSISASLAFDLQHNDWWYHAYPHRTLLLLAIAYLLADLLYPLLVRLASEARLLRAAIFAASGAVAVLLCAVAINPQAVRNAGTHSGSYDIDQFFAQYKPSTTVYVFSTSVLPLSIAFNDGLNWGGRFAHLWMIPAIIQNELGPAEPKAPFKRLSPDTVARLAALQRKQSAEDLNYWRPAVVLVEQCVPKHSCQGLGGKNFDMLSWFLQSPEFAAAWSHYQRQPGINEYEVYTLVP